jgi:hypothetical protein
MTGPKVDIGRDLVAFVAAQASYSLTDTAGESYPEAADAIRAISGSAGGTVPVAPREDKFGTATAVPGIVQKRTAEGSLEGYVMPSGTITTAPDIDELLTTGGWTKIDRSATTTTVSGSGSSAVRVDVSASTSFAVGDGVLIQTNDATELYEARRVVGVDVVGTSIDVEPPLTFTPANGQNVRGAIAYKPSDTRDTSEDALTLWLLNNNSGDRISGWTPDSYEFTIGGEDAARYTASGVGQRHDRLGQTPLSVSLTTSTTSMIVTYFLGSSGDALNTYWTLSDGGNTTAEVVKVTGISGSTWTVTRAQLGTSDPGTTWDAADTAVTPYRPTGTYAGSPVPSTSGQIVASLGGYGSSSPVALQCNNASLSCGFGIASREDVAGTTYKLQGYTMNQREVRATLSGWTLKAANWLAAFQAFQTANVSGANSQQISVAVQSGQVVGGIFGWVAPRLRMEDVSVDRGAEEVTLDLTGLCEGTSSGADEILLIFG